MVVCHSTIKSSHDFINDSPPEEITMNNVTRNFPAGSTKDKPNHVILWGIKNCDTMKKAMTWLTENGIAFEFVDYKKAGVAEANLPDWMARAGWETLLNRRGLMWKKLTDEERSAVDAKKAQKLMAQYPALIKRPVLDTGDALLVGFSPEAYAEHFA